MSFDKSCASEHVSCHSSVLPVQMDNSRNDDYYNDDDQIHDAAADDVRDNDDIGGNNK